MSFENSLPEAPQVPQVSAVRPACPVCGTHARRCFFERKAVPIHQNVLMASAEKARACSRGDMALAWCEHCGQIFNTAFEEQGPRFSAAYNNTQTYSPHYQRFLEELSAELTRRYAFADKRVLEVGCGRGLFLNLLCRHGHCNGIGYDPSYVGPETAQEGRVRYIRDFFDAGRATSGFDFAVCRHVLDVIPAPRRLLAGMRRTLSGAEGAVIFVEVPDAGWILRNNVVWDMGYERCSYFCQESFRWLLEQEGFRTERLIASFEGHNLWLEARLENDTPEPLRPPDLAGLRQLVARFAADAQRRLGNAVRVLQNDGRGGGCCVWGAAGKGVTFLNLVDPKCQLVRYAVDLNPFKQGKFVPGTGHPIVGPEQLARDPVAGVVLLNPVYRDEVLQCLRQWRVAAPLYCL